MTFPARIQSAAAIPSEVGPDDFCRACYGAGCECCDFRGHTVASRPDVILTRRAAPIWWRIGGAK